MAALDFPASPSSGQKYSANGSTWEWNGSAWIKLATTSGPTDQVTTTNDTSTAVLYPVMVDGAGDNKELKLSTSKLKFDASAGGLTVTGTSGEVTAGVGNTALIVDGDARVLGILTVGSGTVKIDSAGVTATGVATFTNFKTGTTNVHNVGVEAAGINVLGADTPIGTGATVYNSGLIVSKSGGEYQGVVTASTFKGAVEGTVQTAAQPNITSLGTLGSLNVTGNATIGGVLTYEDVKNVDAIGIITARDNVHIAQWIAHIGDLNTTIGFPSNDTITLNTLSNERLRITSNGHIVTQGLTTPSFNNDSSNAKVYEFSGDGTVGEYGVINISSNQDANNSSIGQLKFVNRQNSNGSSGNNAGSKQVASIQAYSVTSDTNAGDDSGGLLTFHTKGEAAVNGERLRIDDTGRVLIGGNVKAGDGRLIVYSSDKKHPAIKCAGTSSSSANGWTLLGDNYLADESQVNLGVSYSSSGFVISRGVKVSDIADNVYLSSQDSYADKPTALKLDMDGSFRFLNTNTNAIVTTDSAVTLTEKLRITPGGFAHIGLPATTNAWDTHAISLTTNSVTFACPGTVSIFGGTGYATANMAGGGIRFIGYYDSSNFTTFAHVAGVKENTTSGDYAGALTFHTRVHAGLGDERLRITSEGRLGVGIQSPTKKLDIATSTSADGIRIKSTGSTYNELSFDANRDAKDTHLGRVISYWNGNAVSYISMDSGDAAASGKNKGYIRFWTADGSGNFERLRIASDGKATFTNKVQVTSLGVGTVPDDHMGLHILQTNPRILLKSSGTNAAKIFFGDSSSTDPGVIEYAHSSNTMFFGTNNNGNRLAITSDGELQVSTNKASGYVAEFNQLHTSNSAQININSPTDSNSRPVLMDYSRAGNIHWSTGMGYNDVYQGYHICMGASLSSGTANSKFVVTSNGYTGIGNYAGARTVPVTSLLHVATNWDNGGVPMVHFEGCNNEAPGNGNAGGNISFQISDENANVLHKIWNTGGGDGDLGKVYYAGKMHIGNTFTAHTAADDLVLGTSSGSNGMTILTGVATGSIFFNDGSGNEGVIQYVHTGTEHMRIKSEGYLKFDIGGGTDTVRITDTGRLGVGSGQDTRAYLDARETTANTPLLNFGFNDGSFYRNLGTVGPGGDDGRAASSYRYLHIRLRTVWNDASMTMFGITGYSAYSDYTESYFGCYRYGNSGYRSNPYGQIVHNQKRATLHSMYNTAADPGYLVLVLDSGTNYIGYMIEHIGAGGSYGSSMQQDLEILEVERSSTTDVWK